MTNREPYVETAEEQRVRIEVEADAIDADIRAVQAGEWVPTKTAGSVIEEYRKGDMTLISKDEQGWHLEWDDPLHGPQSESVPSGWDREETLRNADELVQTLEGEGLER